MNRDSYAFIYDDFLNDRQYERQVAETEARLVTLDLNGRTARLALFRSAKDLVDGMVLQGVKTIVVIGNDRTLDKVMWFLPDLDVTLGYLPIAEPTGVAEVLGIPCGAEACDVLAARLIETVDVGRLDDRYFLTEVHVPHTVASVDVEGSYRISPVNGGSISIRNLGSVLKKGIVRADARDGLLEVVIVPQEEPKSRWNRKKPVEETHLFLTHGEIVSSDPIDVYADNHVLNGRRFRLSIVPKKLRMITGRNRRLSPEAEKLQKTVKIGTFSTAS